MVMEHIGAEEKEYISNLREKEKAGIGNVSERVSGKDSRNCIICEERPTSSMQGRDSMDISAHISPQARRDNGAGDNDAAVGPSGSM